jgi:hypothetical protein
MNVVCIQLCVVRTETLGFPKKFFIHGNPFESSMLVYGVNTNDFIEGKVGTGLICV